MFWTFSFLDFHHTVRRLQVNVVLASSELSFPYSLRDLGFNAVDIIGFVVADKVPPDEVYLLRLKLIRAIR